MFGDLEVDDAPTVVGEHDEDEEDAQARGGDGEEVDGDQFPGMVGEERPPGLRRLGTPPRHEARHGTLGHLDTDLQELTMDARGTPKRVRGGHAGDQSPDLSVDGRATSG
jgi:hypothetical protein